MALDSQQSSESPRSPAAKISGSGHEQILSVLGDPRSYPDATQGVRQVETHISHVFLTDDFVYKLKKPVRLEFLDFSTVSRRKQACEDEVRLNRRFSPDVYCGVVPITRDRRGVLRIGGDGKAVDWLVKMRRLPDDASLDSLLRSGRVSAEQIRLLAAYLAQLYAAAAPTLVRTDGYRKRVERHVTANRDDLLRLASGDEKRIVARVHAAQRRWLALFGNLLERRVCDGRIVDGHGDLRPEHIYLTPAPVLIDCLEFSDELRQVDVVDELSFLAMECQRLGCKEVGERVFERYRTESQDAPPAALVDFYKSYRAAVRAKVALLRAEQVSGAEALAARSLAGEYLRIANDHARALAPPVVLLVRGLSGSGKSTLAASLAHTLGLDHLQTDELRRTILGSGSAAPYGEGRYSPENRQRVYEALLAAVDRRLADGFSVVIDGTFPKLQLLEAARDLADLHHATLLIVECRCPESTARERLIQRAEAGGSSSDADYKIYRQQRLVWEEVSALMPSTLVDTTDALRSQVMQVLARLAGLMKLS